MVMQNSAGQATGECTGVNGHLSLDTFSLCEVGIHILRASITMFQ